MTAASLFDMATEAHRAGQLARAEHLYRSVLEQAPKHTDAMLLLSDVVLQSGRLEEAAALLEHATRVAPGNAIYLANLGDIYRCLGQSSQAVAKLLLAIARKPTLPKRCSVSPSPSRSKETLTRRWPATNRLWC